jgi:hypothetical protein
MKAKSPKSNLSGSLTGQATAEATLTNNSEMILHSSENRPIVIPKSNIRLVQAEQVSRVVLADGSEIFVRETPQDLWLQLNR